MTNTTSNIRPHVPRSCSAGHDADGEYEPIHDLCHTQSLPASFPSTHSWRQKVHAMSGPDIWKGSPSSSLTARGQTRREHAIVPVGGAGGQFDNTRYGGLAMRRSGCGAGVLDTRPHSSQPAASSVDPLPDELGLQSMAENPSRVVVDNTSNGTRNGDGSPDVALFRLQAQPTTSAAEVDLNHGDGCITAPGAPLLPSTSLIGVHHHFPGLNHHDGGPADEDALLTRPLLTPARGRSHNGFRTVIAQRRPMLRFATCASYR